MHGMQSSGTSQRAETWTRTQHLEVTLRSSHSRTPHKSQDWNGVLALPIKAVPTTRMLCNSCLCNMHRKAAVLQLFIHFLLYYRRGKKIQLSKIAFRNLYTGKNFTRTTQELNKYHTVTPMDRLHFSFTSRQQNLFQFTLAAQSFILQQMNRTGF